MPTKAYTRVQRAVEAVRTHRAQFEAERRAILAHPDYSEAYKARVIQQRRADYTTLAKSDFSHGWQSLQTLKKQLQDDLSAAYRAKDDGLDWQRIQVQSAEYGAKLKNPPPGRTRQQVLDALVTEAQASREGRRALALASGDYLASGDLAREASRARATLDAWQREADAPVDQAKLELAHLQQGEAEFRRVGLDEETFWRGRTPSGVTTEWQADALGETSQAVVWSDDDTMNFYNELLQRAALNAAPSPVPPGVLSSSK